MSGLGLPSATSVHRGSASAALAGTVRLAYDDRMIRRKRLTTTDGGTVMVDLPETVGLDHGDHLILSDGRAVRVEAAIEPLMDITGDLPRLAWHIGNRHAPCQIMGDRLRIRLDRVLERMLTQLGARVTHVMAPFTPEGGAYGMGRTMGHSHADPNAH